MCLEEHREGGSCTRTSAIAIKDFFFRMVRSHPCVHFHYLPHSPPLIHRQHLATLVAFMASFFSVSFAYSGLSFLSRPPNTPRSSAVLSSEPLHSRNPTVPATRISFSQRQTSTTSPTDESTPSLSLSQSCTS
ncbi:unnamed protein product [Mortierella alpina]